MFLLRKANIVVEGIIVKERIKESKDVAVIGLRTAFNAADLLNPVDKIITIVTIEFREFGALRQVGCEVETVESSFTMMEAE